MEILLAWMHEISIAITLQFCVSDSALFSGIPWIIKNHISRGEKGAMDKKSGATALKPTPPAERYVQSG